MYKILHIMGSADFGGISTVVLNLYQNMDRSLFHFDVAVSSNEIGKNEIIFKNMGSTIYKLPKKNKNIIGFVKALDDILKKNHYDAVHVHHNETSYLALLVAKKNNIKCRIAHAHSTVPTNNIISSVKRLTGIVFNNFYSTDVIACGEYAGIRQFGKKAMENNSVVILHNNIDTKRFNFNEEKRKKLRRDFNLNGKFVIGFVGRLEIEKNPLFALKVLIGLLEKDPDIILVFIGDGALENDIRVYAHQKNISDHIIILGKIDDVAPWYQALDTVILPSLYEGYPVVAIEAMASGLPIFLSENITKEINIYSKSLYLSLKEPQSWVDALQYIKNISTSRCNEAEKLGFDISITSKILQQIYLNRIEKKNKK